MKKRPRVPGKSRSLTTQKSRTRTRPPQREASSCGSGAAGTTSKMPGGQKKPCVREGCDNPTACLHCRCLLGNRCPATYLHSPPCLACFGGKECPVGGGRLKGVKGGPFPPGELHHCSHVCEAHRAWLAKKPPGPDGKRRWLNKLRPICDTESCRYEALCVGVCVGVLSDSQQGQMCPVRHAQ